MNIITVALWTEIEVRIGGFWLVSHALKCSRGIKTSECSEPLDVAAAMCYRLLDARVNLRRLPLCQCRGIQGCVCFTDVAYVRYIAGLVAGELGQQVVSSCMHCLPGFLASFETYTPCESIELMIILPCRLVALYGQPKQTC